MYISSNKKKETMREMSENKLLRSISSYYDKEEERKKILFFPI